MGWNAQQPILPCTAAAFAFSLASAACTSSCNEDDKPRLQTFVWQRSWGPCPTPGEDSCLQRLSMDENGAMTYMDQGTARSAGMQASDFDRLESLLTDDATLAAMRDTSSCGPEIMDMWETVEILLEGEDAIEKEITECTGEPYDSIRLFVEDIQSSYFP